MPLDSKWPNYLMDFKNFSKNRKFKLPRNKMDSLLSLRLLQLDGWRIGLNNFVFGLPYPFYLRNTIFVPPRFSKVPKLLYSNFLGFLKFKNPIFPIEVGFFTYKLLYQKVPWNEVSIFCYIFLFFYIFISKSSSTISLQYLSKNT